LWLIQHSIALKDLKNWGHDIWDFQWAYAATEGEQLLIDQPSNSFLYFGQLAKRDREPWGL
jgi:hypothetical protein